MTDKFVVSISSLATADQRRRSALIFVGSDLVLSAFEAIAEARWGLLKLDIDLVLLLLLLLRCQDLF